MSDLLSLLLKSNPNFKVISIDKNFNLKSLESKFLNLIGTKGHPLNLKLTKNTHPTLLLHLLENSEVDIKVAIGKNSNSNLTILIEDGVKLNLNLSFYSKTNLNLKILGDFDTPKPASLNLETDFNTNLASTNIEVKSIVSNGGSFNFCGQIIVKKNYKGIEANLVHKGLILDRQSHIVSKPELLIESEHVICTHGTAISFIKHEIQEYLAIRGLNDEHTKSLLKSGFFGV